MEVLPLQSIETLQMSPRKKKQRPLEARRETEPYDACEVKKYWNDVTKEQWIEACFNLIGTVVSFGEREKLLMELFFLAPYTWPDCGANPSGLSSVFAIEVISSLKELRYMQRTHEEIVKKMTEDETGEDMIWCEEVVYKHEYIEFIINICSPLEHYVKDFEDLLDSTEMTSKERSLTVQKEAKAVLEKLKFGQGFTLQSSCVSVIKGLVLKHSDMEFSRAVDTLPLPELMLNMIDPIVPTCFDSAICPMYKMVSSFARGRWLNDPLKSEDIFALIFK